MGEYIKIQKKQKFKVGNPELKKAEYVLNIDLITGKVILE